MQERNKLKKFMAKDRFGNSLSYEFDVPPMEEAIPPAFQPGPKGTDTVPAWLTPGENVVNAEASRKFQPMIDKMNEYGRQVQKMQGGPVPSYAQEGEFVSKITPQVLDALMQVESGGDPTKVSPVGASGPYQIMKDTALKPGYGVTPISLEDRFNPTIARNFADSYLKGIEKANPNFSLDQILQSYHSGVGNVLKNNLGPQGKAYAPKVNAELKKADSGFTFPSFISSASASTLDNENKEVPKLEGLDIDVSRNPYSYSGEEFSQEVKEKVAKNREKYGDDVKLDGMGNVLDPDAEEKADPYSHFGSQINIHSENQPKAWAEEFAKGYISKEEYDNRMNLWKQKKHQSDAFKLNETEVKNEEITKGNAVINSQIEDLKEKLKKTDPNNKFLVDYYNKQIKELEAKVKPTIGKTNIGTKVAKDVVSIVGDDPSGGAEVAEMAKQDENTLMNKGLSLGKEALGTIGGWFESMFKEMFSGPELARMAVIYAGSRAMGYSHGGSLNYSMKNYLTRVDAEVANRKKNAASASWVKDYKPSSLQKYIESGDMSDLEKKGATLKKPSGSIYATGFGQLPTFTMSDGTETIEYRGKYYPFSHPMFRGRTEKYDSSVHGDVAVSKRFSEVADSARLRANNKFGLRKGTKDDTSYDTMFRINAPQLGKQANIFYRNILRRNNVSINDAPQYELAIGRAMDKYMDDYAYAVSTGKKNLIPNDLEAYLNAEVIIPTSGVQATQLMMNTSVKEMNLVNNKIKGLMPRGIKLDSPEYQLEYSNKWLDYEVAYHKWAMGNPDLRAENDRAAADRSKDKTKWSAFMYWVHKTPYSEVEKINGS